MSQPLERASAQSAGMVTMELHIPTAPEQMAQTLPYAPPPMPAAPPVPPIATAGDEEPVEAFAAFGTRDIPGWSASLGVHLLLIIILWGIKLSTTQQDDLAAITALEDSEQQIAFDTTAQDQVGSNADKLSFTASGIQMAQDLGKQPETNFVQTADDNAKLEVVVTEELEVVSKAEMLGTVDVKGTGTENIGGTEGAIDRLTMEIGSMLRQKKTLVVWLFDASLSLKKRRDQIADRFENVYRQLDALEFNSDRALKTAVATYGKGYNLLTEEPVDDVRPLVSKVRDIPNDDSGEEKVFAAVGNLVKKFQKFGKQGRTVAIIIVTDERGDDADLMEEVILQCRRAAIKVYVVGNGALFGRKEGYVRWQYEDMTEEDLPVDQGPETIRAEGLSVGFWAGRGPDLSKMASGYGPYALTRLCKETQGLYFIAEEGNGQKFNSAVMRNYQPDYSPIRKYDDALAKNKTKAALVTAAEKSKVDNIPIPTTTFQANTDNILREQITEAQKPAAVLDYKLNELAMILSQGEKDRPKLAEPRWRAAYDLAMGRILAMRVRIYGYNKLLAEMKGLPKTFQKKGSNEWRLVPSKTITAGADVSKMAKNASVYLKRVLDEHPDTPWALLAEREYSTPMGWEWQESTGNYPMIDPNESPAKKQIRLAEEEKKRKEAAAKAPPPKPKPKL